MINIMYDIKLDNNNDLNILDLSKDLELIDNDERVVQQIKIRLMTWYNEWFLDKTVGVRYDYIFNRNKKANKNVIVNLIKNQLESISDVNSVDYVTADIDNKNRLITINFNVIINFKRYNETINLTIR